jgi:hypothetical protein
VRALYLLNFVLLGAGVWPTLIKHAGLSDPLQAVAFSFWSAYRSIGYTQDMVIGMVLDLVAIPWPNVLATYPREHGDRWRGRSKAAGGVLPQVKVTV